MAVRLAYFVDSMEVGGSELNAVRTLECLDRSRFDLTVFHMGARGPLLERYAALALPMVRVAVTSFKHPSVLVAGLRFVGELRRRRIQILHSHDIYSNIFSIPWAKVAGTPVAIASKRWHGAVPGRLHVVANGIASRYATRVLANSEAVVRSLVEEDRVAKSRIEMIPNFVGPEAFAEYPPAGRRELFSRSGIPANALTVGVVARLAAVKDHAMLLRAASRIVHAHPEVHFVLIGDGPERAALFAQARAAGIAARVHFLGTLPNTPNPHGLLDISVLPSRTEGFPNAVVEAMAAGRPVVATAVGGTPEAVVEGRTALLVPPGDDSSMAKAVQTLIESPGQRDAFGAAGRERARTRYYVDVVLDRLSDWYASLLPSA